MPAPARDHDTQALLGRLVEGEADAGSVGDDHDGFDVYQPCTYVPNDINAASYTSPAVSDPCLSQGGLDQNIYAAG